MGKSGEANRRRNQIVAQRTSDQAALRFNGSAMTRAELWEAIEGPLEWAMRSAIYSGQTEKACELARAREAARALRLRGVQLQLL